MIETEEKGDKRAYVCGAESPKLILTCVNQFNQLQIDLHLWICQQHLITHIQTNPAFSIGLFDLWTENVPAWNIPLNLGDKGALLCCKAMSFVQTSLGLFPDGMWAVIVSPIATDSPIA